MWAGVHYIGVDSGEIGPSESQRVRIGVAQTDTPVWQARKLVRRVADLAVAFRSVTTKPALSISVWIARLWGMMATRINS
jgi:hypothetical protein